MGVLPNSQFGDVAVLDISNSGVSDVVLGPDGKKSKVGVASAVSSGSAAVPFCALMALGFLFFGNKKKAASCKEYWSYMFCNEDARGVS